jgi:hypothetical protein
VSLFQGERPRVLDLDRMGRANAARRSRGYWTREEVDLIMARAQERMRRWRESWESSTELS